MTGHLCQSLYAEIPYTKLPVCSANHELVHFDLNTTAIISKIDKKCILL